MDRRQVEQPGFGQKRLATGRPSGPDWPDGTESATGVGFRIPSEPAGAAVEFRAGTSASWIYSRVKSSSPKRDAEGNMSGRSMRATPMRLSAMP